MRKGFFKISPRAKADTPARVRLARPGLFACRDTNLSAPIVIESRGVARIGGGCGRGRGWGARCVGAPPDRGPRQVDRSARPGGGGRNPRPARRGSGGALHPGGPAPTLGPAHRGADLRRARRRGGRRGGRLSPGICRHRRLRPHTPLRAVVPPHRRSRSAAGPASPAARGARRRGAGQHRALRRG